MKVTTQESRSPKDSLEKSLQELDLIKKGKLPKKTWNDLKAELK